MFDLGTLIQLAFIGVDTKARAEGRPATREEYDAAVEKAWDAWMDARVATDMARAGFVKTPTGWERPKRGILARLFGF